VQGKKRVVVKDFYHTPERIKSAFETFETFEGVLLAVSLLTG
jgi:hypothetical protein